MKASTHPEVHSDAHTVCSNCNMVFEIPCTVKELNVETCRSCHPIYTGKRQVEMKGGRVERFRKRLSASQK